MNVIFKVYLNPMRLLFSFLFFLMFCIHSNAQDIAANINWEDKRNVSTKEDVKIYVPGFDSDAFYYDYLNESISYIKSFKRLDAGEYQLTDVQYESINKNLLSNIKSIPSQFSYEIVQSKGRDILFTTLKLRINFVSLNYSCCDSWNSCSFLLFYSIL